MECWRGRSMRRDRWRPTRARVRFIRLSRGLQIVAAADPAVVWSMLPLLLYPAFVLAFVAFTRALLSTRALVAGCVGFVSSLLRRNFAFQLAHAAAYGQNLAAAWYWAVASAAVLFNRPERCCRPLKSRIDVARFFRRGDDSGRTGFGGTLVHVGVAFHVVLVAPRP